MGGLEELSLGDSYELPLDDSEELRSSDSPIDDMFGGYHDGVRKNILLTPEDQSEPVHASVQLGLDVPCQDHYHVTLVKDTKRDSKRNKGKRRDEDREPVVSGNDKTNKMRRENRVKANPVDEYPSTNTSVGNGDLIESDEMREKNSDLSALHRQMGFHKKKSRLISLEEETRAFNKLGGEKREEHLSIDISVENSKLVETDNNMVVAPSSQAATKHRIGQSVNLPGASLRTGLSAQARWSVSLVVDFDSCTQAAYTVKASHVRCM